MEITGPWGRIGYGRPGGQDASQNATLNAWRSAFGEPSWEPVPGTGLDRPGDEAARALLGCVLRSTLGGEEVVGVIVETEAYLGPQDPASHAADATGRTRRNASMFGRPGTAYVYRSYGIHWCLNVVTGPEGFPAAVLLRGMDPVRGLSVARERRGGREPLCAGPGRLSQALALSGDQDGHPLGSPPLELLEGWHIPEAAVGRSGRIGISRARDWPLRFFLKGHPQVSRGPRPPPGQGGKSVKD